MKSTNYTFNFKGGKITVRAMNENQARIVAIKILSNTLIALNVEQS